MKCPVMLLLNFTNLFWNEWHLFSDSSKKSVDLFSFLESKYFGSKTFSTLSKNTSIKLSVFLYSRSSHAYKGLCFYVFVHVPATYHWFSNAYREPSDELMSSWTYAHFKQICFYKTVSLPDPISYIMSSISWAL